MWKIFFYSFPKTNSRNKVIKTYCIKGYTQRKYIDPKSSALLSAIFDMDVNSEELVTFRLQHSGGCTGMFWRGDPLTKSSPPSNDNWPRNGSLLRGNLFLVAGEKHLKVKEFQQAGTTGFVEVPEGTWMLFEQQGPLLRDV